MFGTALTSVNPTTNLTPVGDGLPSVAKGAAAAAKGVLSGIIRRGAEQGSFALSPTHAEALDLAVLSAWSVVHGMTLLLLDGFAGVKAASGPFTAASFTAAERIADYVSQLLIDGISTTV